MDHEKSQSKATMREHGSGGAKRYAPWLQKALRISEETHAYWKKERSKLKASAGADAPQEEGREASQPPTTMKPKLLSIWDAVEADDVEAMQRFLKTGSVGVYARREGRAEVRNCCGGGGATLLHEAAFHGSVEAVRWLMQSMESEARRDYVNTTDTAFSQTTPLIAVCRGAKGDVTQRLKIVQLLIQAGADVEHRDAHGDNALHWCARTSNNVLLRWLLKATDAGANAVFQENYKREKPLDIAKRMVVAASKSSGFAAQNVLSSLRSVDRKCNMRLKMQVIKRQMTSLELEKVAAVEAEFSSVSTEADNAIDQVERLWKETLRRAEENRKDAEAAYVKKAAEAARAEAIQWLDTKEGKSYVKKHYATATEEIKLEILRGSMAKPKDMKKAATHRACETYIRQQEEAASKLARSSFISKRPPLASDNEKLRNTLSRT